MTRIALRRLLLGIWLVVAAVGLLAPWPYFLAAALLTGFVHFAVLDALDAQKDQAGENR